MPTLDSSGDRLTARRAITPVVLLVIAAFCFILPLIKDTIVLTGTAVIMYVIMAVSWTIFSGPTGYVSLATAAFFGLGVYASALFSSLRLPLPVLMLMGGAAAFIIAVIMGAITLRLRGVYFTIFTFGLVELLKNLILWIEIRATGRRGRIVPSEKPDVVYYYLLGLTVILIIVAYIIKRSRFGKALVSIGESEDAAAHIGVNTTFVKIIAFAISSFFMGAVGAAMATRWAYIDSYIAFDTLNAFLPVLMVIFGGMKKLAGPVIGAAVFAFLREMLIVNFSSYYLISIGVIMVVAILCMPEGLIGLGQSVKDRLIAGSGIKVNGGDKGAGHADT